MILPYLILIPYFRFMIFHIVLTVFQDVLFCFADGHAPEDLPFGIVNYDVNSTEFRCPPSEGCILQHLTCKILQQFQDGVILQVNNAFNVFQTLMFMLIFETMYYCAQWLMHNTLSPLCDLFWMTIFITMYCSIIGIL